MWKFIVALLLLFTMAGCATQSGMVRQSGAMASNGYARTYAQPVSSIGSARAQDVLEYVASGSSSVYGMTVGNEEFYGNVPCRSYQTGGASGYACRHTDGEWQKVSRSAMVARYGQPSAESPEVVVAKRKWRKRNPQAVGNGPRTQVARFEPKESVPVPKSVPKTVLNEETREKPEPAPKQHRPVFTPWHGSGQ